ncbi:hypothetical protein HRbin14_01026 [bacterium HR14]|nr:hypothetical protein HRbin14_01026 [bacterium HR14]
MHFGDGGKASAHAQPIAPHDNRLLIALGVGIERAHRLAILHAQLEDVPHFNPAHFAERSVRTARALVARLRHTQVRPARLWKVASPAYMDQMRVRLVRARDEILQPTQFIVCQNGDVRRQANGTCESDGRVRYLADAFGVHHLHAFAVQRVLELVGVQFAVAAHQRRHRLAVHTHQQGLHQSVGSRVEKRRNLLYGACVRCRDFFGGRNAFHRGRGELRVGQFALLGVCAVAAGIALQYLILATLGDNHELLVTAAADCACFRLHNNRG